MITLEPINQQNAMIYKEVRLRALQDTPSAFGSTYAKESQFSDSDWVKRVAQLAVTASSLVSPFRSPTATERGT